MSLTCRGNRNKEYDMPRSLQVLSAHSIRVLEQTIDILPRVALRPSLWAYMSGILKNLGMLPDYHWCL